MSERADDEFKLFLARAFDRAWKRYYRPTRISAISASVARPALAKHVIVLAKEGLVSLDALAEAGLVHLVSLTPEAQHWGHLRLEGAGQSSSRNGALGLSSRLRRPRERLPSDIDPWGPLEIVVGECPGGRSLFDEFLTDEGGFWQWAILRRPLRWGRIFPALNLGPTSGLFILRKSHNDTGFGRCRPEGICRKQHVSARRTPPCANVTKNTHQRSRRGYPRLASG
jgi:hypothetical protein